jgi:cyclophilin family peptidyl-prolyl cis-trans isomerase
MIFARYVLSRFLVSALLIPLLATSALAGPVVVMDTSLGKIKLELFPDKAPQTVKNFLKYADDRHYDGTIFHRVIANFMIQGGGHEPGLKEKKPTRPPIKNESNNGLSNTRGTIAMARTQDPNSATVQFFINVKDNAYLDGKNAAGRAGYTVFGRVVDGMDVVDRIKSVATGQRGTNQDVPVTDVVIRSIRRAADLSLAVSGALQPGKVLTITARIDNPVPGQYLALELPPGLERAEGKEIQPVAEALAQDASLVIWKARAIRVGEFDVTIRSSTGARLVQRLKIAAEPH